MTDNSHQTLERIAHRVAVPEPAYDRLLSRRDRKDRNRRLSAGVLAIVVIVVTATALVRAFDHSEGRPANRPTSIRTIPPAPDAFTCDGCEAESYGILGGHVTFQAAPPWASSIGGWDHSPTMTTLDGPYDASVKVMAAPLAVETGCKEGPAPADAEALARSIRSDPDLEATEPVAVEVGGIEALRMDVVAATGASVCQVYPGTLVLAPSQPLGPNGNGWAGARVNPGYRIRLYLLDLPGGSARILAIAIVAREPLFERVVEAVAPIVDSFQFRTG